ncbi:RNA-binding domain-containing protein [Bifidobacterium sp. SO4]|uniref:RNA-binding domain-containing protein n=1 Tax=Bifidobacterium sp. SO4 TaxID=2809030 RepID=UPI001BDCECED|nr:RNA-binding domain-containing protein [Bifidobacterium sp. SO4]MBT1169639.1 putative DNA binding domain-containing protein [Bifidobacterium sp. SO4]
MNAAELAAVLERGENISVEFKRCGVQPEADTFETLCSFNNRFGGSIYLGVLDDGTVEGVNRPQATDIERNLVNVVGNPKLFNVAPAIETERIEYDGRLVIRVWVPAGPAVVSFKHVIYDRVADVDRRITSETQIAQMHIRKQNHFSEQRVYRYLKPSDFRFDLLPRVRKLAALKAPGHPWAEMDDMELMRSADLYGVNYDTGEEGFNLAAVMLLGKDEVISRIAPAYKTDVIVRRENLDRYDDRLIVDTNLIEAQAQVAEFAKRYLPDRFMLEGAQTVSPRDIIIRELVSNLMIHREFVSPYPAKFLILGDGVHTENASKAIFQGQLAITSFKPVSKNPFIAKFFRNIGLADELGSGMRNLYKYSKPYSGKDPVLDDGDVFEAFVPVRWVEGNTAKDDATARDETEHDPNETVNGTDEQVNDPSETVNETVNETVTREQRLLELLRDNPSITYRQAANALSVSYTTVWRTLRTMQEAGFIERIGSDKRGTWRILTPSQPPRT